MAQEPFPGKTAKEKAEWYTAGTLIRHSLKSLSPGQLRTLRFYLSDEEKTKLLREMIDLLLRQPRTPLEELL